MIITQEKDWLELASKQPNELSHNQAIQVWNACRQIKKQASQFIKQFEDQVLANLNDWPEIEVKTADVRKIEDAQIARDLTQDIISHDDFMKCVTIPVLRLQNAYVEAVQGSKKEATAEFNSLMSDNIRTETRRTLQFA